MADVKALEHPTLKVPYEVLNKKFRAAQKNIDREVAHVQASAKDLDTCLTTRHDLKNVTSVLNGMVEKLRVLKRKSEESVRDELEAAHACKRRLEHLKDYQTLPPSAAAQWRKKRLDRMLVEYFLRAGYYNTALKLATHSQIQDLTNIDLFLVSKEVEESLERQETAKCLAWCHDNRSKLRKMKSCLEFNLRQQEYIELIRTNKRLEAVRHARKYFTNLEEMQLFDVQRVMGLLAFPSNTEIAPYKDLLDKSRWQSLVQQFRFDNFKLHQLHSQSIFSVTLQCGLSALKTPHCYKNSKDYNKADCPVCSRHLNELARPLPSAHCAQSRLVCFISGENLNEHNPPMMLPNGYVYGCNSLMLMAAEHEGSVVCPRTSDIYSFEEAEKVFVM